MNDRGARRFRVLLVDDDPGLLRLLTIRLKSEGYEVAACESAAQAQAAVPRFRPDAVVTDLRMAEQDGIGLLKDLQRRYPALPVVLMTAHGTIPDAVLATQSGAFAFLTKPVDRDQLLETLGKAFRVSGFVAAIEDWRADIVTRNPLMEERLAEAQMAASSDSPVLVTGQPGTGKRLFAKAIHRASRRSSGPFMSLAAFGLTAEAIRQAALTDAYDGTILLEDVDDLGPGAHEALLEVLEAPLEERARIISLTSRDLRVAVARGHFREDLYYKLSTLQINLPPLSQRRDDIPLLAAQAVDSLEGQDGQRRLLSPEALELLVGAEFPGNVQQLRAVVRQAAALSSGPVVSAEAIQRALGTGSYSIPAFDEARDEFTYNYLVQLLQITRGNVTQAARLAGRNRTDFYKLLSRHDVSPDKFKP